MGVSGIIRCPAFSSYVDMHTYCIKSETPGANSYARKDGESYLQSCFHPLNDNYMVASIKR